MNRTSAICSSVLVGLLGLNVVPAASRTESGTMAAERVIADEAAPQRLAQRCFTNNGKTVCF